MFLFRVSNTEDKEKAKNRPRLRSFRRISMDETVLTVEGKSNDNDTVKIDDKNQNNQSIVLPNRASTLGRIKKKKSLEKEKDAPKKVSRMDSIRKLFHSRISQKNKNPDDKKESLGDNAKESTSKRPISMRELTPLEKREKINLSMRRYSEQTRAIDFILEEKKNTAGPAKKLENTTTSLEKDISFSRSNSENDRYWSKESLTPLDNWSDDLFMFLKDYGQESGYDSASIRTATESVSCEDSASIPSRRYSLMALDSISKSNRSSLNFTQKTIDNNTKIDENNHEIIENIIKDNSVDNEKEDDCELKITQSSQENLSHDVPSCENEKLLVSSLSVNDTSEVNGDKKLETSKTCRVIGAMRKDGTYESYTELDNDFSRK